MINYDILMRCYQPTPKVEDILILMFYSEVKVTSVSISSCANVTADFLSFTPRFIGMFSHLNLFQYIGYTSVMETLW